MSCVTAVAEWGAYGGWRGKREVASGEEALNLCAEIETHADAGRLLVGFTAATGHFFAIALGHEHSCVMYWESVDPPYFQSRGSLDQGADPLDFAYEGQHTELPATSLIGRDVALRALVEFVDTGGMPDHLEWQET